MRAVHEVRHPAHRGPRQRVTDEGESLEQAWEKPWATVRMAQLCSVMRQLPSGSFSASAR